MKERNVIFVFGLLRRIVIMKTMFFWMIQVRIVSGGLAWDWISLIFS